MAYVVNYPQGSSNITVSVIGGGGGRGGAVYGAGGTGTSVTLPPIQSVSISSAGTGYVSAGQVLTTGSWQTIGSASKTCITVSADGDIYQGDSSAKQTGVFARLARIEAALGLITRDSKLESISEELRSAGDEIADIEEKLFHTRGVLELKYPELKVANDQYRETISRAKMEEYLTKDEVNV
jgi:hypothetical protein